MLCTVQTEVIAKDVPDSSFINPVGARFNDTNPAGARFVYETT